MEKCKKCAKPFGGNRDNICPTCRETEPRKCALHTCKAGFIPRQHDQRYCKDHKWVKGRSAYTITQDAHLINERDPHFKEEMYA